MDKKKMEYFKKKLLKEMDNVYALLKQMEENEVFNSKVELSTELSELSIYDNHPSDMASEIFDAERGMALKEHELTIIKKIEDSLHNIENGSYGKCHMCGREIPEERLEFIPYAEFCVNCQDKANDMIPRDKNNRPVEEDVLGRPFGYGFNDFDEINYEAGYDAEDSYQDVQRFEWRRNVDHDFLDEDPGYVEPIELVSNEQYKNQLPD
ncbi:TraR/DksA C4-type zinc finger protein [Clostridium sp. SYSU_GA19001]|uniref:TraR/DksA C4-type zinc finger protein n=1 Tax=Clostridium caldaquaticum TaxID=2940653 RepID=UPI002076EBAB|nr:TraR/DksA C4-type zinc finger protein [Clostridium caldaquaticum]MCM8711018.1 TraR/DksA C4-type zinc finger protein [Clostridium caldaquaticum]